MGIKFYTNWWIKLVNKMFNKPQYHRGWQYVKAQMSERFNKFDLAFIEG